MGVYWLPWTNPSHRYRYRGTISVLTVLFSVLLPTKNCNKWWSWICNTKHLKCLKQSRLYFLGDFFGSLPFHIKRKFSWKNHDFLNFGGALNANLNIYHMAVPKPLLSSAFIIGDTPKQKWCVVRSLFDSLVHEPKRWRKNPVTKATRFGT